MFSLMTLALATGLATALPETRQAGVTFVDNYNDLPTGRPVGLYHGIQYGGATVAEDRFPNGTQSIVPHSQPKFAEGSTELDFFQLGATTMNSYIQLVRGPGVGSFDLNSLWFACAVDDGTTYGIAQGCTLAVTGFKAADGSQVSTATYAFAPEVFNEASFAYAQLPADYTGLQNVSIGVATGSIVADRTAVALDDVSHVNH